MLHWVEHSAAALVAVRVRVDSAAPGDSSHHLRLYRKIGPESLESLPSNQLHAGDKSYTSPAVRLPTQAVSFMPPTPSWGTVVG